MLQNCDTRRGDRLTALAVFATSLILFWYNAAPSVTFHDSGEFALAASCFGIPHPPGAPTWSLLASAFVWLGKFGDPARGTNLFSGLCGALTLSLLAWLVQTWVRSLYPDARNMTIRFSGAATALLLMRSPAFLEQSLVTEQYTLLTFLMA